MSETKWKVLSLGAGVQSTAVLLMSAKGVLPKLDCAIFADTGWEPAAVYTHLKWLKKYSESAGIPVHTVVKSNIKEDALVSQVRGKKEPGKRWASMPYYTLSPEGKKGMIRRQCTSEYKIYPIEKFMKREILGLRHYQHSPKSRVIEQWFGISKDEMKRVRISKERWKSHAYPLVGLPEEYLEFIPRGFSRKDCLDWMKKNFPDIDPPRSACIGCPYHSNAEWQDLYDNRPEEWAEAVEFDEAVRKCGGMRGDIFLHRKCLPLSVIPTTWNVREEQPDLFSNMSEECLGYCGS